MNSAQGTTNTPMLGMVRIAGVLCIVGGAGWLVNGVLLPFRPRPAPRRVAAAHPVS
jgi:hypothetical protein